jgi:hypothetical protein
MSTVQVPTTPRFTLPSTGESNIEDAIESMLEASHLALLAEMGTWEWTVQTMDLSDITCDEDLIPRRNAALQERSRAVAKAQLVVGMAPPLVVVEEDNLLIDGYSRYTLLTELGDSDVTAYHGTLVSPADD